LRLTKAGAFYITLTLLTGFAAVNTGNNLLFLIVSALLAFMAVSGIFGWMNMHGNVLRIELPDELYAGRDTLVNVSLENRKSIMPTFLVRIRFFLESADFTLVKRRGTETDFMVMKFPERGFKKFEDIFISLFNKIEENFAEIHTLSQIRDSLLPKLMSGKIRVPVEVRTQGLLQKQKQSLQKQKHL